MSLQADKSVGLLAEATVHGQATPDVGLNQAAKRVVDVILATMGLVLFAPSLVLVSVAIGLDCGSPVFVREILSAGHNQAIRVLKFRVASGNRIDRRMTRVAKSLV